jgi:hypothetical protein
MALLILLLLSVLSGALLVASTIEARIAENHRIGAQLRYAAESGIEEGREMLRHQQVPASTLPFIDLKLLADYSGREAGRYSVYVTRSNPLTLQSVGTLGKSQRTIETRLMKSGFPLLFQAVTLAEVFPVPAGADPQLMKLKTPAGLERLVRGISRNASDILSPAFGGAAVLSTVGSPSDYRVVVVNGDCTFASAAGFGMLVVRGDLTLSGSFTWNGLVLVIGQGVLHIPEGSSGWIEGGIFVARTRDAERNTENVFGSVAPTLGESTIDLGDNDVTVAFSPDEWERANAVFPYVPISYREF